MAKFRELFYCRGRKWVIRSYSRYGKRRFVASAKGIYDPIFSESLSELKKQIKLAR